MEFIEKETPTTNQTNLLLKSSLLAIVSFSRGNSSNIFQLQWCYSEPTESAVKQVGFVLYYKKPPETSHKCTQRRYSQGNNREEVERESCSFQLMKIMVRISIFVTNTSEEENVPQHLKMTLGLYSSENNSWICFSSSFISSQNLSTLGFISGLPICCSIPFSPATHKLWLNCFHKCLTTFFFNSYIT